MSSLLDPTSIIKTTGYIGVFAFVTLESGFLLGFVLPGDSLLFTAGLLASQGYLSIWVLIPLCIIGAILGDSIGYYTGHKLGPKIFSRKQSPLFSPQRVGDANRFFKRQGAKSLILARFIPAVRTFTPIVAGVGEMHYRTFIMFNAIGGALWGALLPVLGYTLGRSIPGIDRYLLPIILVIVIASITPIVIQYIQTRLRKNN